MYRRHSWMKRVTKLLKAPVVSISHVIVCYTSTTDARLLDVNPTKSQDNDKKTSNDGNKVEITYTSSFKAESTCFLYVYVQFRKWSKILFRAGKRCRYMCIYCVCDGLKADRTTQLLLDSFSYSSRLPAVHTLHELSHVKHFTYVCCWWKATMRQKKHEKTQSVQWWDLQTKPTMRQYEKNIALQWERLRLLQVPTPSWVFLVLCLWASVTLRLDHVTTLNTTESPSCSTHKSRLCFLCTRRSDAPTVPSPPRRSTSLCVRHFIWILERWHQAPYPTYPTP